MIPWIFFFFFVILSFDLFSNSTILIDRVTEQSDCLIMHFEDQDKDKDKR